MINSEKGNDSVLLLGYPSNGLIGTFTVSYLIHYLKMQQIGEIEPPDILPTLFIEDGDILAPIRIYKKNNLYVIISDLPFELDMVYGFAESVIEFAKKKKISKVIIVSGMGLTDPQNPKVYGLVTHPSLESILYQNDVPKFLTGSIFGTDATIISALKASKIPGLVLCAECHPFFPDPKAALSVINFLSKILKIQIDTKDIKKKLEFLRIQHRNLMQETISALQQQQKKQGKRSPQIYR
jgi:uncharacterized protein